MGIKLEKRNVMASGFALLLLASFSASASPLPPAPSGPYQSLEDAGLAANTGQANATHEPLQAGERQNTSVLPPLEFSTWRWGAPTMQSLNNDGEMH